MVVSEQYPDLKANQNMLQLTEELTSTENKVSFARQAYNDSVMSYNTTREVFPNVIFAGMFGFLPAELFKIEDPTSATRRSELHLIHVTGTRELRATCRPPNHHLSICENGLLLYSSSGRCAPRQ